MGGRELITLNNESLLADKERILGPDHPDTLITRHALAGAYHDAGRVVAEAIAICPHLSAGPAGR